MDHTGQITCATTERTAFLLRVMKGCSYNGCRFCDMFRRLKAEPTPLEDVEAECRRVADVGGRPKKVFLLDGDAMYLPTDRLTAILGFIHQYLPGVEEINTEATVSSVLGKTPEDLALLAGLGMKHVYLGIETALDDVLSFMNKEHNMEQAYESVDRLKAAGMCFDCHIITGIAGEGRGEENSRAVADFLNKTHPHKILNFTLSIPRHAPLIDDVSSGRFRPASVQEQLEEMHYVLKNYTAYPEEGTEYYGINGCIRLHLSRNLKFRREKILEKLDQLIDRTSHREPTDGFSGSPDKPGNRAEQEIHGCKRCITVNQEDDAAQLL